MVIMLRRLTLSLLFSSFVLTCPNAFAHVGMAIYVAPQPQEIVYAPVGYTNCYYTAAGVINGVWIPAHQVCEYSGSPYGSAWISGYWGCVSFCNGACSRWRWYGHHWVRPGYYEYGMHRYGRHYGSYPQPFPHPVSRHHHDFYSPYCDCHHGDHHHH